MRRGVCEQCARKAGGVIMGENGKGGRGGDGRGRVGTGGNW